MASNDPMSGYISVFSTRYSSPEMVYLFSQTKKIKTWRQLWFWLAKAQQDLGLVISDEQLRQLEENIEEIDWDYVAEKEKETRHDVMAHIHAYKRVCPLAGGIIHQGATSAFVQDNSELILIREALEIIISKTACCIDRLAKFADRWKSLVTVGRTHYQPASLTTVGKRACLWIQELVIALERMSHEMDQLRFRSIQGATGTKDSFLKLFSGDETKVRQLSARVTELAGFTESYKVTGQTYPRLQDATIVASLSYLAAAVHKICMDIRMLQALHEIQEPFETTQVGDSEWSHVTAWYECRASSQHLLLAIFHSTHSLEDH